MSPSTGCEYCAAVSPLFARSSSAALHRRAPSVAVAVSFSGGAIQRIGSEADRRDEEYEVLRALDVPGVSEASQKGGANGRRRLAAATATTGPSLPDLEDRAR